MIKPRILKWAEIREMAEDFRKKYVDPPDLIPVPIEQIIEFKLGMEIWPLRSLRSKSDIEAFLSSDLKVISIDADLYNDPRNSNRLRFTLAHEVGHAVLHRKEIIKCNFSSTEEWIAFRDEMDEDDLIWFEQQAYEFAGRLLVPKDMLLRELKKFVPKIIKYRKISGNSDEDVLLSPLARIISDYFGVSEQVIIKRIKGEKLFGELGL